MAGTSSAAVCTCATASAIDSPGRPSCDLAGFGISCIDKIDPESRLLQNVVHGNPVHARGLHRYGANTALPQPGRHVLQFGRGALSYGFAGRLMLGTMPYAFLSFGIQESLKADNFGIGYLSSPDERAGLD